MEEELDKFAGPDLASQPPKLELPLIRLNGKTGQFSQITGREEKVLGNEIEVVPLKARRILTAFEKDRQTGEIIRYFTNEHNSWNEVVNLFSIKPNSDKADFLDVGTSKELKQRWANLKMTQVLYCLKGDELVKLNIKGASLGNWFEFLGSLEDRAYRYIVKVERTEEESPLGNYFVMTFKTKEVVKDLEKIAEKMKEIHEKITEIDAYYSAQQERIEKEISAELPEESEKESEKPEKSVEEVNAELDVASEKS